MSSSISIVHGMKTTNATLLRMGSVCDTYRVCALQFSHELSSIRLKARVNNRPALGIFKNHLEIKMKDHC
jgi:hypothetical protein